MQDLNFTPEAFTLILTAAIVLFGSFIIGWNAYQKKIHLYWYFFLSFFLFSIAFFLYGFSRIYLNKTLNSLEYVFMVLSTFFLFIAIDTSTRESIDPYKMLLFGILGGLVIYFAFLPGSIVESTWYGYPSLTWSGMLRITASLLILTYGTFLCYYSLLTFIKSPKILKKDALILLIGSLTVGVIGVIVHILTDLVFPIAFGVIIMAIAFVKEPKLFFVLPFRAHRLTVIHNKTGMSLYDYNWSETEIEEQLLAGLLQAVRKMSLEVLKKGNIEEIIFSQGVLIFYQSKNITAGLLASKASKYLKECVEKFTMAFEEKFEEELVEAQKYIDTSHYFSSIELIEDYFEFVPKHL